MQRTLVLAKPDAVQRGLIGEIVGRFERKGMKVVGLPLLTVPRRWPSVTTRSTPAAFLRRPGRVHHLRPCRGDALEGPDAIAIVRLMVGKHDAERGGSRNDPRRPGVSGLRNLIHASDAPETAEEELGALVRARCLVDYGREVDAWIVAEEPARA